MNLDQGKELIENAMTKRGLNPVEARTGEGGEWMLFMDGLEVYIDIWDEPGPSVWNFNTENPPPVFQVIAVVSFLPKEKLKEFYEEILHLNFNLFDASFSVNSEENLFVVKHKSLSFGLTEDFVGFAIDSIGYYAHLAFKALQEKYDLKKIEEN